MTPREALLATICQQPADWLPRMVYADWLEEHGASNVDIATVEFVRQAYAGDCSAWLKANWKRLVPTLIAVLDGEKLAQDYNSESIGPDGGIILITFSDEAYMNIGSECSLVFSRGFVIRCELRREWASLEKVVVEPKAVVELLEPDQPLIHAGLNT